MRKPFLKRLLIWAGIPLLSLYISTNWYQLTLIQGRSMEPTYTHLQLVVLDKYSQNYEKGDVIAFSCEGLSAVLIKRIAACPGDTAVIRDGTLYVNGEVSRIYPEAGIFQYAGILSESVSLGSESYLVLGDNTMESKDSRYREIGLVSEIDILGKVCGSGVTENNAVD